MEPNIQQTPKDQIDIPQVSDKPEKKSKLSLIFFIIGSILIAASIGIFLFTILTSKEVSEIIFDEKDNAKNSIYSILTGEEIADASKNSAPTFCIQTPNGTDGARPQAGLNQAGVVFEAIAEAGITRFAAIYQDPTSAVIGPIRSLRLYYLEWDTPFDCTIVHAGGAYDALTALRNGGYKDLTENYTYMYRGNYARYDRLWNNLFTNATLLKNNASDSGNTTSNPTGFAHLTPSESEKTRIDNLSTEKLDITTPTTNNTSELTPKTTQISINFGSLANFNPRYVYNKDTNTYNRSYESGAIHEVYDCPSENLGEVTPESSCTLTQVSPSVVIAMVVQEKKASDNYHEAITTIGSGDVYIFQNGIAIEGTWEKSSANDQIKFYDASGAEISLAPGQAWVSAVPAYGTVEYQ